MARPTNAKLEQDLLQEVKKNYSRSMSADSQNRELALSDIRFVDEEGAQWDRQTLRNRGNRPSYTFDRTSGAIDQVKGDQRQNTPQIKILPADENSDKNLAQIIEGHIRDIERRSSASAAYNTAFDFALKGGFGCWHIYPEFIEDSFDQRLCISRIENPFTAFLDPTAKDFLKRDANWGGLTERVDREAFEDEHEITPRDLDLSVGDRDWLTADEVRIATYYKRIRTKKTLAQLDDGRVMDWEAIKLIEEEMANPHPDSGLQPVKVLRKRDTDVISIRWWKLYGGGILEGPTDYKWKYIPIVPVYGRVSNIEGKKKYRGLVRKAKDAQKAYNTAQTAALETVFSVPKAPYMITAKQIEGWEAEWRAAQSSNPQFLHYNADAKLPNGGKPTREPLAEIPAAMIALSAAAADNIKAATGKYSASLGEEDNASLPGAIRQRNTEGDVSSYEFTDNLKESLRYSGEIIVDMMQATYDGERTIRTVGADGKEDFVKINQRKPDGTMANNLSSGKFDVAVDLGPSFTTQRQQAADNLIKFAGISQAVQQIASDLIAKNMDFQGADELERRLRIPLIQQGVIPPDKLSEEEKALLPQGPPPPDPTQVALLNKLGADAARSQAQAQKAQVDTMAAMADLHSKPQEMQKLIADTIGQQLTNLMLAGEVGIHPKTGKMHLMKYLNQPEDGNALRRQPVTINQ